LKDFIKKEVARLKRKHKTNNPFDIAEGEKIIVIREPLGSIHGYYNKYARQKFIHVNSDLDEINQYITCGHELGHARLHPNSNTPCFRANTFYSIRKLERQANRFDAELLIDERLIDEFCLYHYSLEQLAAFYNVPIELVQIKFNPL
jgi:Predicted Zn peptidase